MVSEKDTSKCLQLRERELEAEKSTQSLVPVAGQRWAVVVEGVPVEAEGEEVELAFLGLRYL